jgi:phosphoglycerate kinase
LIPKKFIGFGFYKELYFVTDLIEHRHPPVAAIIGGAEVCMKLKLLKFLAYHVDKLLIGGSMVFPFYKALGYEVGDNVVHHEDVEEAKEIVNICKERGEEGIQLVLAIDALTLPSNYQDTRIEKLGKQSVSCKSFPSGHCGFDIGPRTVNLFKKELESCQTIFMNGNDDNNYYLFILVCI